MIRTGFGLNCAHISHCFAGVYHNAISELCKGLTITLESVTSPHVLRFAGFDHRRERRRLEQAFVPSSPTLVRAAATVRSVGAVSVRA